MFSGCRQSLIWRLSRNEDVVLKGKKIRKKKEKRNELLSYRRLSLLEAIDYFDIQHLKINFLSHQRKRRSVQERNLFEIHTYWSRSLLHLKGQESEGSQKKV